MGESSTLTTVACCAATAAAILLLQGTGVTFSMKSNDGNNRNNSNIGKHHRKRSKETFEAAARNLLSKKALNKSHSHLLQNSSETENGNDSEVTVEVNDYHEQLLRLEERAEARAEEVKETKKKMEVLLYMQEAVVNVNVSCAFVFICDL